MRPGTILTPACEIRAGGSEAQLQWATEALTFATVAHQGQFRKPMRDRVPYIVHPYRVACKVVELDVGGRYSGIAVKAALLHDTIEDTHVTRQDITERFGTECAHAVWGLTDCLGRGVAKRGDTRGGGTNRAERNKLDREWLRHQAPLIRAVKLLDCADNLLDWLPGDPFMVIMMEETAVLRDILAPRLAELCPGALEHFDAAWAKAQANGGNSKRHGKETVRTQSGHSEDTGEKEGNKGKEGNEEKQRRAAALRVLSFLNEKTGHHYGSKGGTGLEDDSR